MERTERGDVVKENEISISGEVKDELDKLRKGNESYSDTILRLVVWGENAETLLQSFMEDRLKKNV